jgi:hypothetical protein
MSARPGAKNLEDQTGPIDNLCLPAPLEIALLHRAQGGIDDRESNFVFPYQLAEVFKGAAAKQAARARACDAGDLGADDIEADGPGEPNRLLEPCFDRSTRNLR